MTYRVIYTERVMADIAAQVDHLREEFVGEDTIERWFTGLFDRIDDLYDMPRLYGLDHAATERNGYNIHKMTHKGYIVRYRIHEASKLVEVLSFFHGSRRREV